MKKILMAFIAIGSLANADFTKSGDIVTDSTTGLMWQDDETEETAIRIWAETVIYCEALKLGGFTDWRLPNINELGSLVDDNYENPAISPVFTKVVSGQYWSSTTYNADIMYAWIVDFFDGGQGVDDKSDSDYVRCVRAGQ